MIAHNLTKSFFAPERIVTFVLEKTRKILRFCALFGREILKSETFVFATSVLTDFETLRFYLTIRPRSFASLKDDTGERSLAGTNVSFEQNSKIQFTAVWYNISKGENNDKILWI